MGTESGGEAVALVASGTTRPGDAGGDRPTAIAGELFSTFVASTGERECGADELRLFATGLGSFAMGVGSFASGGGDAAGAASAAGVARGFGEGECTSLGPGSASLPLSSWCFWTSNSCRVMRPCSCIFASL